jgi:hypothetical protein
VPEFGEVPFVSVAVQVIPVLAVVVIGDEFMRRDRDHTVHRLYASTAVAVGLGFAIIGEVAGFQALLTGPTPNTIPNVDAGLLALGATALLPRLAELHLPKYGDAARRFVNMMLPLLIGSTGVVILSLSASLRFRLLLYVLIGFSFVVMFVEATKTTRKDLAATMAEEAARPEQRAMSDLPDSGAAEEESRTPQPPDQHTDSDASSPTTAPTRPRWWLLASMAGVAAIAVAIERRRKQS